MSATRTVTKQSETRERVLDLIERLGVGDAIPSERQLSSGLGVSRLTVRAALDDLVREGYLLRRRGSGTFVSEPKIAQELTMTSFTEDMQRRGMVPSSRTLELRVTPGGGAPGTTAPCVAVGARRDRVSPEARRPRDDGHRDAPRARGARPGAVRGRSRAAFVLRPAQRHVRDRDRRRHADDRAHRDERGGVRCAGRPAALAGVRLRARHALTGR